MLNTPDEPATLAQEAALEAYKKHPDSAALDFLTEAIAHEFLQNLKSQNFERECEHWKCTVQITVDVEGCRFTISDQKLKPKVDKSGKIKKPKSKKFAPIDVKDIGEIRHCFENLLTSQICENVKCYSQEVLCETFLSALLQIAMQQFRFRVYELAVEYRNELQKTYGDRISKQENPNLNDTLEAGGRVFIESIVANRDGNQKFWFSRRGDQGQTYQESVFVTGGVITKYDVCLHELVQFSADIISEAVTSGKEPPHGINLDYVKRNVSDRLHGIVRQAEPLHQMVSLHQWIEAIEAEVQEDEISTADVSEGFPSRSSDTPRNACLKEVQLLVPYLWFYELGDKIGSGISINPHAKGLSHRYVYAALRNRADVPGIQGIIANELEKDNAGVTRIKSELGKLLGTRIDFWLPLEPGYPCCVPKCMRAALGLHEHGNSRAAGYREITRNRKNVLWSLYQHSIDPEFQTGRSERNMEGRNTVPEDTIVVEGFLNEYSLAEFVFGGFEQR